MGFAAKENIKKVLVSMCLSTAMHWGLASAKELPDFTELVEKQGAAVVNVSITQVLKAGNATVPGFPFDEDDPAFEFFKRFIPKQQGIPGAPREYENKSLGSEVIISADGYVLTNAHVVNAADEVMVKLTDKREFKARIIGADKRTDVALLKIEASNLPVVKLGDPNKLKVGEWVVAIGSPFGFENSVTAGIVSAKGRSLPQENYVPFIQTDVAINPGNSGGPLFNMKGEVVGINSQIYSRSGGFMGLSFAIPIDLAIEIQQQLKQHGKVSRGRLGVSIQDLTKEIAESFGLKKQEGALVGVVEKGGPADKAGLKVGDVILRFDNKAIAQSSDLPRLVGQTRPGTKSVLHVWRNGQGLDVSVTVGEMPSDDKQASRQGKNGNKAAAAPNRLGLVLSEITPEQKKSLGISNGLLVESLSNATLRTSLRPGDIIRSIVGKGNQVELSTIEQFNQELSKFTRSETITLLVRRGGSQLYVTIKGQAATAPDTAQPVN